MSRVCHFYAETGHCRFGDNCRFIHEQNAPIEPTIVPLSYTTNAKERKEKIKNFSFLNPTNTPPLSVFQRGTFEFKADSIEIEEEKQTSNFTDKDIEQFNKTAFDIGHVPLQAPSKEYCK